MQQVTSLLSESKSEGDRALKLTTLDSATANIRISRIRGKLINLLTSNEQSTTTKTATFTTAKQLKAKVSNN